LLLIILHFFNSFIKKSVAFHTEALNKRDKKFKCSLKNNFVGNAKQFKNLFSKNDFNVVIEVIKNVLLPDT
jgi:predicted membrane protein